MEGEGASGWLYEYYHEISLTPLLGMFKCGNFPLDRHNDMIWRHDTDTCMQSTSWRHRPIISTSLQPWPGITELSPDYLISSTGSRHEAMRPPLPFIFLAYVSCVVYSTEVNIHRGDLNNLVIHNSTLPQMPPQHEVALQCTAHHVVPVSADLLRLLPSATSFTWNIVTVDVHNLLN